jgi:hypothetical protein
VLVHREPDYTTMFELQPLSAEPTRKHLRSRPPRTLSWNPAFGPMLDRVDGLSIVLPYANWR